MTAPASGLPLLVDLAGRRVVVVGAGPVAAAKLRSLGPARADLTVIAPEAVPAVRAQAAAGALRWEPRPFRAGDLAGATLAVAATSDTAVNDAVAREAAGGGVLCVRVDAGGTAAFMGAVRRGPLTLAVASGVPALSRRLRAELGERYGEAYGQLAELLGELRADEQVAEVLGPLDDAERAARWRAVLDTDILALIVAGRTHLAKELALACLSSSSD